MLNFIIKEHRLNIVAHDRELELNMFFLLLYGVNILREFFFAEQNKNIL